MSNEGTRWSAPGGSPTSAPPAQPAAPEGQYVVPPAEPPVDHRAPVAAAPAAAPQYAAAPAAAVAPEGRVVEHTRTGAPALRIFQILTAAAGAVLFIAGLVAVFRVDFGVGFFETSGAVADFGFSPALAVAAILLGGATMVAALAAQDRAAAAVVGLLTVAVGIAALVLEGEIPESVGVDRRSALLFVVLGAVIFVLALIPWWSGRRRTVTAERLR